MSPIWKSLRSPILAALALTCGLGAAKASSIHYVWEYPESYTGSGSAYPAQAAPGATLLLRARIPERANFWSPWISSATFQWYFNDVAIPGETGWTLTLANVTAANSGNYSVRWTLAGFVNQCDYFPLTVVAPPPTPLISSTTVEYVTSYGSASMAIANFENGRSVFLRYHLRDPFYYGKIVVVGPSGAVEAEVTPSPNSEPPIPNFLPSGRFLRATAPIAGLRELNGNRDYAIRTLEELPDGRVLGVVYPFRTVSTDESVFRLNADLTLDPTFDSAANQFRARAVRQGSRFLVWESRQLVARLEDGSMDPGFAPIALEQIWPELTSVTVDPRACSVSPLLDGTLLVTAVSPPASGAGRFFARITSGGALIAGSPGTIDSQANVLARDGHFYGSPGGRGGTWRFRTTGTKGDDPTFYAGTESTTGDPWDWVSPAADGNLLAGKTTTRGMVLARLRTTDVAAPLLPAVVGARVDPITPGGRVAITPRVLGEGALTYQWVSLDGGELPADTTSRTLVFDSFQARNVGHYQLRITGSNGTYLSPVYRLVPDNPVQLLALSGRGVADAGQGALIAGWSQRIAGSLLLRGVGPTLGSYGVQHFASDPSLLVTQMGSTASTSNDDWTASLAPVFARVGASPLLNASKDAALDFPALELGTAQVKNATGRGVALAELYTTAAGYPGQIQLNGLALRGHAGTGEETLIGGFVLGDASGLQRPQRLLIRIVGPQLANYGIQQPMTDPVLQLFSAGGALLAGNDDWDRATAGEVAAVNDATGIVGLIPLPAGGRDSAVCVELTPGAYTVHASGGERGAGIALIEIYRVD